jgi:hypothetical protein
MILHHDGMHTSSSKEAEPPPPPPGVKGAVTLRMGDTNDPTQQEGISEAANFWPTGSSERQVILVPMTDSDEFLAFGIYPVTDHQLYCCRVPFVAWGKVSTDLEVFLNRMTESTAEVGLYSEAPLEVLQQYVDNFPSLSSLRTGKTLLSAVDWKQDASNEDDVAVPAA